MAKVSDLFYAKILQYMDVLPTTNNVKFLKTWQSFEGGNAKNNPLNTTYKLTGATNYNSANVKNYETDNDGIKATAKTLLLNYYKPIVKGLKDNQPLSYYKNNAYVNKALKTWGTIGFANYLNKPSTPSVTTPSVETPSVETPSGEKKNWINEHKKPLLISLGVLLTLTLTYYATKKRV